MPRGVGWSCLSPDSRVRESHPNHLPHDRDELLAPALPCARLALAQTAAPRRPAEGSSKCRYAKQSRCGTSAPPTLTAAAGGSGGGTPTAVSSGGHGVSSGNCASQRCTKTACCLSGSRSSCGERRPFYRPHGLAASAAAALPITSLTPRSLFLSFCSVLTVTDLHVEYAENLEFCKAIDGDAHR